MSLRTMKKGAMICVVLCGAMALAARASGSQATAVPALVLRAAAVYGANVRGIIGMQRHFLTALHGGPFNHTEESDSGFLMRDGSFIKIKYFKIADDGKPFSAQRVEQRDAQTNRDWSQGKIFFKEPYDRRFFGDYTFGPSQRCAGCPAGIVAVSFASGIRDAQHGNGMMWIELGTGRVDRLTYIPNVLPSHATSGSVTETSGWAMSNVWYVTRIDGVYQGRAFIFRGTGAFKGVFDHFRRFSNVTQGEAALNLGTI